MSRDTNNDKRTFTARISNELYESLRHVAYVTGRSMNDVISEGLRMVLAKNLRDESFDAMVERSLKKFEDVLGRRDLD
jgi:hypothetical protein